MPEVNMGSSIVTAMPVMDNAVSLGFWWGGGVDGWGQGGGVGVCGTLKVCLNLRCQLHHVHTCCCTALLSSTRSQGVAGI
jgi:hypothetical protein